MIHYIYIQLCYKNCGGTAPTPRPTSVDTPQPTPVPSARPTESPVADPTPRPTASPTPSPVDDPTPRPTDSPVSQSFDDYCPELDFDLDLIVVVDRSHALDEQDCRNQEAFVNSLVATLFHPDFTRVGVVGYGNSGAGVMLSLDDSHFNGREQFLTDLSNIDLCDDSTIDDEHKCGLALTAAVDELFNSGNANAAAVIVHIQNGECGDSPCDASSVITLPQTDINTYVLNFGPTAVDDETLCAISGAGEEYYSASLEEDGLEIFLEHFVENFCYERMCRAVFSLFLLFLFVCKQCVI